MLKFILIFGFCFAYHVSVAFRIAVKHPILTIKYSFIDLYNYIRYKKWRVCKTGKLVCYSGGSLKFGSGKTLSAVPYAMEKFKKFNDKLIYDEQKKKWVKQYIRILSNVELIGVPFEKLVSLEQVVKVVNSHREINEKNDIRICTIVLGDEFSILMFCRNFKTNISPLFLNSLLTSRHNHLEICYTSQKFSLVDSLLRSVTSYVIVCHKIWRCVQHFYYDADELENATNPLLIEPFKRTGFLATNKHYNSYDTLAIVDDLKKSFEDDEMMSEEEVLNLLNNNGSDMDSILKPSRKYRKIRKRMK